MEDVENEFEFGSDFDADEEAILSGLLAQASTQLPLRPAAAKHSDVDDAARSRQRYALRPRRSDHGRTMVVAYETAHGDDEDAMQDVVRNVNNNGDGHGYATQPRNMSRDEVRGDFLSDDQSIKDGVLPDPRKTPGPELLPTADEGENLRDVDATMAPEGMPSAPALEDSDTRSPLERFRPRGRPLSVTDLVSPAWCEQQWAFVLAKHGRKKPNAAMTAGSRVHRKLEAEVHVRVSVDVSSREDAFGLRIWNAIQGLRTLRTTGRTRELEVWGMFGGRIVNGVIDELSYVCPDTELEAKAPSVELPEGQMTLTDFFKQQRKEAQSVDNTMPGESAPDDGAPEAKRLRTLRSMRATTNRVYICDVKTRANPSVPRGAAFRPTLLQLMLYRHLLGQMAVNAESEDSTEGQKTVVADINSLTRALRLDADATFTDGFLAELGGMSDGIPATSLVGYGDDLLSHSAASLLPSQHSAPSDGDALDQLLAHATLRQLWALLQAELRATFPQGAKSCGDVLQAEYRDPDEGAVRGIKTFRYSEAIVTEYVDSVMQWWRGEREPQGVDPPEAYKCRYCDFADECTWRVDMVEQDRARYREVHGHGKRTASPKKKEKEKEIAATEEEEEWERSHGAQKDGEEAQGKETDAAGVKKRAKWQRTRSQV